MRDGTVLRADVWRPETIAHRPVLLQRTPYDKSLLELAAVDFGLDPIRAVEHGYVVVIQDCRGRYASDGVFDPFRQETNDGVDTIAWCRTMPWSDGRVGMWGASYVGATSLLAAAGRPAGLAAIAPNVTGSDYWEGWTYQGGALQMGFIAWWAVSGLISADLLRLQPGPERDALLETWRRTARDPAALYRRLPIGDLQGIDAVSPYVADWLAHEERDAYWRSTAPRERYEAVEVPGLHVAGWYDLFAAGSLENFTGLRARAATEAARRGQRLVVGPWAHGNYGDTVGDGEFGFEAAQADLDMTGVHLRFFDRHVRGLTDPALVPDESTVRVFLMGANRWLDADDWPVPGMHEIRWYLHSAGAANTAFGDGRLDRRTPATGESPDRFVYDPVDPVPTAGGATFLPGFGVSRRAGLRDQQAIEGRPDVLVYTSDLLDADIDVIGSVRAELTVATNALDTDITAKLVDVSPDGAAMSVCDGILDLRHRQGLDMPAPVEPGAPTRIVVELGPTAMRFAVGHRLRLEVSSSNFPRFARNPNTGGSRIAVTEGELRTANQTVFHDAERPSALLLPIDLSRRAG